MTRIFFHDALRYAPSPLVRGPNEREARRECLSEGARVTRREGMTPSRYCPDPILEYLTWPTMPPFDADVRADVVRIALSRWAMSRHYARLACVFYSADVETLKGLLLALAEVSEDGAADLEAPHYRRALKEIAPTRGDATFARLASVAADVLDWDAPEHCGPMSDGWTRYVVPAWLVLCDEMEFEREERAEACAEWWGPPSIDRGGYSRNEARAAGKADARRWRE